MEVIVPGNLNGSTNKFEIDTVTDLVLVTCSNVTSEDMVLFHCLPI